MTVMILSPDFCRISNLIDSLGHSTPFILLQVTKQQYKNCKQTNIIEVFISMDQFHYPHHAKWKNIILGLSTSIKSR